MHPFDTIIVISIACCVGFPPAIYVKKDHVLAAGYFVASTIGAFAGSYLFLIQVSWLDKPGVIIGGLAGATLLVVTWHFARKNKALGRY
ncbi:hypothetical protein MNBD_ALPHA09-568 [hydrothermal vent metagenome]|uniref:Uncharacterized protein n=1 Tax=hydrothermal vent metagenome TaxID=652676 RepID=A0A3B0T1A1_9ZZZZ